MQVEYGPMELDLNLRVRVHCLEAWLKDANVAGLMETSPGVRSCMIEYDVRRLTLSRLLKVGLVHGGLHAWVGRRPGSWQRTDRLQRTVGPVPALGSPTCDFDRCVSFEPGCF